MKVTFQTCCGVDVHKSFLVATIIKTSSGIEPSYQKRRFSTFNNSILEFKKWLLENECLYVCMESTGKYWVPVFNLLEDKINVVIANPKWVKAVKGNKDDTKDSKWIGDLFRLGLVKGSYIPCKKVRILREYTRYRYKLVSCRSSEKNRYQNALTVCNVALDSVVSDIFGKSSTSIIDYLPEHQLSRETFPFIEMLQGWSEQKVGITRYNQGLDSDSLNKTATGISKIMAASQQRLRMIARNLAETGIVPLYQFLIEMNQHEVDQEMVVRLTGEYLKITPDDLKGQFDVEIKSNIGLQDSQLIVQQLMVLFTQIVPSLLQMGIATPLGVYSTAKQIIESMGFTNPAEFIGATDKDVEAMMQQQDVMQQLPQMLAQIMQAAGIQPEQAAMVVKGLESVMQPQQQGGQPGEPGQPGTK